MIERLEIPEVWVYTPRSFEDERGAFCETFNRKVLAPELGDLLFVQDNEVATKARGTLRGMHFQSAPKAQDKLVRVLRGSIFDVAIDLRRASATFGQWVSATLSSEDRRQIFVPKGFAHGYLTLEPGTVVLYKVTDFYSPAHEGGVAFDDPTIGIEWPIPVDEIVAADRDRKFSGLVELAAVF